MHVALTGETAGYYADFAHLEALAKVCERGFFHDGTWSSFRGRYHGVRIDTAAMPTWRFVVCNQNHDQIGNRAAGDRLTATLDHDQLACAALLTLAGPFTPMLFQGEEWAASTPFAVLHLPPRARARRGDRGGPDQGVRADGVGRVRRARPAGPGDVRAVAAGLVGAGGLQPLPDARALPGARPAPPYPARADRPVVLRQPVHGRPGDRRLPAAPRRVEIVVNFSAEDRQVEVAGELLFATSDEMAFSPDSITLPPHAGAMLRTR